MDYVQNRQQMAQQNYWNQKELDNQNYWNEQKMRAQNQENAYKQALSLIGQGFMPDDETLAAAGISKQAAQQQVALVLGETGGGTVPQTTQQAVRRTPAGGGYNNGSLTTSQVKQLQQALGVKVDGMWGSNCLSSFFKIGLMPDSFTPDLGSFAPPPQRKLPFRGTWRSSISASVVWPLPAASRVTEYPLPHILH